jgi:hypothetical protein
MQRWSFTKTFLKTGFAKAIIVRVSIFRPCQNVSRLWLRPSGLKESDAYKNQNDVNLHIFLI